MSEDPLAENGLNHKVGEWDPNTDETEWGKEVSIFDVPSNVRKAISAMVEEICEELPF